MRLALLLIAALPLFGASCSLRPGESVDGTAVSDSLAVRTDSLLISVDSLQFTVAIGYPQITGTTATVSAEAVARANAAIRDSVTALAETFRPEEAVAEADRGAIWAVADVQGGVQEAYLGGDVFSGVIAVYAYTGGAHGNTVFSPINVDLRTGAPVPLSDLFAAGTPWADSLSAHADRALVATMSAGDDTMTPAAARELLYAEGYAPEALAHATFTLGADSLALQFMPYEVAAYAFGSSRVPVAYSDLGAFLRPDGTAARIRAAE